MIRSCVLWLVVAGCAPAVAGSVDAHLAAARDLLARLDPQQTHYAHGQGSVRWDDPPQSDTDCSGFVDHLLMHVYGYGAADFVRWFGSTRPSARRYYDAIAAQQGFVQLARVSDLQPGDFIAVKYLARSDNTGHLMLVDAPPVHRQQAGADPHGEVWQVTVIDSAESGHGPTDTRHGQGADGRDRDGLGRGVLRLYADAQAQVTGFSWSMLPSSAFRGPDTEPVVLGRLQADFRP